MITGVGVTSAPFVNFSITKFSILLVIFLESHSLLIGVTAAEPRQHLPNINMIFNNYRVFNNTEEIGK